MAGYIFLALGILCILVGRILLIRAAFGVSTGWGLGIFLPFGPLLFRLSYPDLAPLSRTFRLIALPCLLAYFIFRSGPPDYEKFFKHKPVASGPANRYGLEKSSDLHERRLANSKEIQRLIEWEQTLRIKKRDLLHSDAEGTRAFNAEVAEYNAALTKATAERTALWSASPPPKK